MWGFLDIHQLLGQFMALSMYYFGFIDQYLPPILQNKETVSFHFIFHRTIIG